MSRPRFLADHDLNEFIRHGVIRREPTAEFLRVGDVGVRDWHDRQVLEFAAVRGLIIVSHDVNTMPKYAYDRMNGGGIIAGLLLARQLDPIGPTIDSLVLIWSASEAEEWTNLVRYLPI